MISAAHRNAAGPLMLGLGNGTVEVRSSIPLGSNIKTKYLVRLGQAELRLTLTNQSRSKHAADPAVYVANERHPSLL